MSFSQGKKTYEINDILKEVSEESILEFYFGVDQIPCVINSPLRVDKKPSFGLFYTQYGICFKDLAKGTKGSLYYLLELKLNKNFEEVLEDIMSNIEHIKEHDKYIIRNTYSYSKNKSIRTNNTLEVKVRRWMDYDLEFWAKSGISLPWLEFSNTYAISHIKIGNNTYTADKYAYCYVEFKDGKPTIKIYQPYSKRLKWLNNHDSSVWDMWEQVLKTDSKDLILASSKKDALCLWENIGIPSISLQAESYLPKPHVVQILKDKFPNIYCFYDNDHDKEENYGRNYGKKMSDLYGFTQIEIEDKYISKDPSDFYFDHGKNLFIEYIPSLLKK